MKRPLAVLIIGCLFIVVGVASAGFHLVQGPLDRWSVPIALVGVVAIVGGIFLILGRGWARWLVLAWMGFHVVVSAFHSLQETIVHFVMLLAIGYFLLTPPASKYFRSAPLE